MPQYCFLEPKFYGQHNDQHPSSVSGLIDGPTRAGTVILGEKLIYDVYETIRNSEKYRDSTLFIITHDEHGGCFDHVIPGPAIPPEENIKGQKDFPFNRLGIRVPMVMISSFIPEGTIVNETFDHTSFIATMCMKFSMPSLTNRDKNANTFEKVFGNTKRDWPKLNEPIIPLNDDKVYHGHPLNDLQKSILRGAAFIASEEAKRRNKSIDLEKAAKAAYVGEAMAFIDSVRHLL